MKKIISILLTLVLLFSLVGCAAKTDVSGDTPQDKREDAGEKKIPTPVSETKDPIASNMVFFEDYAQVYGKLMEMSENSDMGRGVYNGFAATDAAAAEAPAADASEMENYNDAAKGESGDYSKTNVQVEGIDEGDIVKTDGKYIYVLSGNEFIIFDAAGANTRELSRISVGYDNYNENENSWSGEWKSPTEMYISEGRAVIVSYYSSYDDYMDADGTWHYDGENYTCIDIYNVSDPQKPILSYSLGQDGNNIATRLMDGVLYMVTSYYTWDWEKDDPETYIPHIYNDGEKRLVEASDICVIGNPVGNSYTVISAYDVASGKMEDLKTVLGGGDTVYMNGDNLFVAGSRYDCQESEPYKESVYTVVDYSESWNTELTRVDITDGKITVAASGSVPGTLESQFSMDEYDGYLRLVTTQDTSGYAIYTDEKYGFTNYDWHDDDSASWNNLYVLDGSLNIVGSIENLAEDERIYSARFDGDIGYFCTFKNVDPLFAVDLSKPEKPEILSALKIPGFSEYLHVWSDGLLFGLGYDTKDYSDEYGEWTTTDGMKLSMFDTSDPADVTEKYKLSLDSYYSEALYNHKAILVSPEKNIIAFPEDGGYAVYGFSAERGFFEKAEIEFDLGWNSRGLYIGDYFYVVSQDSVAVLSLETLTLVRQIDIEI